MNEAIMIDTKEHKKIKRWIKLACDRNGLFDLPSTITFSFHKRMTRCFGMANKRDIQLSYPLWLRANEQQKEQVVAHEACHIMVHWICRHHRRLPASHGREWQNCMIIAGHRPDKGHDVDRTGLIKQYVKYAVACQCGSKWVSHVAAASLRKEEHLCVECNTALCLTGVTYRNGEVHMGT